MIVTTHLFVPRPKEQDLAPLAAIGALAIFDIQPGMLREEHLCRESTYTFGLRGLEIPRRKYTCTFGK